MADPGAGEGILSLRTILGNYDYLSNWIASIGLAGVFGGLAGYYDKLTGVAILMSLFTSTSLAMAFWPILLTNGYGNLTGSIVFGVSCGCAGGVVLHALIFVIRRRVRKQLEGLGLGSQGGGNP